MRSLFLRIAALVSLVGAARAQPAEAIFVALGDQHSAYGRTAQFVALVDRVKAANPGVPLAVLIDGDTFELGNGVARRSGGAIEFAMLAALAQRAPAILNLGNHEPEFYDLAETVKRIRATGATVIGNITDRASGELYAPASTTLRLGDVELVVAGVTTDLLAQYRAAVRPTLDLANPAEWAKRKFPALLSAAPVKIVLSHAGLKYDRQMLPVIPDGTLFVGAHDHVRFVERLGRTVYFHSGSWNGHASIVRLRHDPAGTPAWSVEQVALADSDPADPALAEKIRQVRAEFLTPEDLAIIGRHATALPRIDAARFVVAALRRAAGVDAAFVGNTTFGDGLPAGDVNRAALDACVRFDGVTCIAEVSGADLRRWLAAANQDEHTPFAQRLDESLIADGPAPAEIQPEKTYRIATTDWGAKNRGRYFGSEALRFTEHPELRLKTIVAQALNE